MGRYTPTVTFETEFDGDQIKVEMRRMTSAQSMRLAPFLRPGQEGGIMALTMEDKIGLFKESMTILPECIIGISGVKTPTGEAVDQQTILREEYFGPLVARIMQHLMLVSRAKEDDAKKSAEPSAVPS